LQGWILARLPRCARNCARDAARDVPGIRRADDAVTIEHGAGPAPGHLHRHPLGTPAFDQSTPSRLEACVRADGSDRSASRAFRDRALAGPG